MFSLIVILFSNVPSKPFVYGEAGQDKDPHVLPHGHPVFKRALQTIRILYGEAGQGKDPHVLPHRRPMVKRALQTIRIW